ncbi:MAG: hypothetical protein AAGA67_03025 [Cyanobacteria bacterium P01_F01_bin.153]
MAAAPQPNESRRVRRQVRRDRRRGPVGANSAAPQGNANPGSVRRSPRKVIRFPFLDRRLNKDNSAKNSATRVTSIPSPTPEPQWLGTMRQAYRWSSVAVFSLGVAVAGVYSQTVRLEQDLGLTYNRLRALERQERELTVAMEQLKDQIARQAAQPESGLTLPKPTDQLFVPPSPSQSQQPRPNAVPIAPKQNTSESSVGY